MAPMFVAVALGNGIEKVIDQNEILTSYGPFKRNLSEEIYE